MTYAHPKIQSEHLDRQAVIYIRQSTLAQVRENTGSTTRQYDLAGLAAEMGWSESSIYTIDQDQAQSASSSVGRDGFQLLVGEVGLQRVGAIFCSEASRLARSNSDWYHLLEVCALTDTLVIDEDGVYDPSDYNDRLLLGIKGTMSEAELHWLHQRLAGGRQTKAKQGQLRVRLPIGLVYTTTGQVVLDPDEEVQAAVRLIFDLFQQYGSAGAVVRHFHRHYLRFPTRHWGGTRDGELNWGSLHHSHAIRILHNPAYAGAYTYGRTRTRTKILPGEEPRIRGRVQKVEQAEWQVLIRDAHPGYISWEQFLHNEKQLNDNRTGHPDRRRGVVREGKALLQGIVLCGVCGRRMAVRYNAKGVPTYHCYQAERRGAYRGCQSIRGDLIDAAVIQTFLEAIQPAHLEVSLAAIEQVNNRVRQVERQWQLRMERVRYEADLARRRFLAVDPENRLVARSLERDWNEKLVEVERLEHEFATHSVLLPHPIGEEERQQILALVQDLPAVWNASTTSHAQRKRLLRLLIKDVTLVRKDELVHIGIRWQTEALTSLSIPRARSGAEIFKTDPAAIDRIRELAPNHTDRQIAQILNQEGFKPGRTDCFTRGKVKWLRSAYQIPTGCSSKPSQAADEPRGDGRLTTRVVAKLFNRHPSTIADWCRSGRLDSIREHPQGPYWIKLTPEQIETLCKPT